MDKSTEAPVSMTFSAQTEKGFPVLFTVRGEKYLEAIKNIQTIETALISAKCIPQVKTFGGKPQAPKEYADYLCPECGGKVVKTTTKNGKKKESCENQKYDFNTKTTSGCTYIKWINEGGTP